MSPRDPWPRLRDGRDFNGTELMELVKRNESPFSPWWDIRLLIREVEECFDFDFTLVDIPCVYKGEEDSENWVGYSSGIPSASSLLTEPIVWEQLFHIVYDNRPDAYAFLSRSDINRPSFDISSINKHISEAKFEGALYKLLRSEPRVRASRMIYHRVPCQVEEERSDRPSNIKGRRVMIFERDKGEPWLWGENWLWGELSAKQQTRLLTQAAEIRAALFNLKIPGAFATEWLRERLFEPKPEVLRVRVAPTRTFCAALLTSKVTATIGEIGDEIGQESDGHTVGPVAAAARQSLMRLIPHIMPAEDGQPVLYRLVLEYHEFGDHAMYVATGEDGVVETTAVHHWDTACIVPAILSDSLMTADSVDLVVDGGVTPTIRNVPDDAPLMEYARYREWSKYYHQTLFDRAPDYERVIREGKDARHLWFALRDWSGEDPEEYFRRLGSWAELRMREIFGVAR